MTYKRTKTIYPPAVSGDNTPTEVRKIERDRGTAWARGLKPDTVAGLVDLSSELTNFVSPERKKMLTRKEFLERLPEETREQAIDRMAQLIGFHSERTISIYHLWWAAVWAEKYTHLSRFADRSPEDLHKHVSKELGIKYQDAYRMLFRRDVSYVVGLFFERKAREMKGHVMWRTTEKALEGNPKHQQLYYDKVVGEKVVGSDSGGEHNFDRMTEEELTKTIRSLRRLVGEPYEEVAEVEVVDVEFETEGDDEE